jgi:phage shock protein PspC (stress-responsive transcriptional regulator)
MKKTQTVNIGGMVFHIDEDAYSGLSQYLLEIESHFRNQEERRETMADIEFRIAELMKQKLTAHRQVIAIQDVEEIMKVMGDPAEFSSMEQEEEPLRRKSNPYRRLYRDPDHRFLGGVCSGIAAYWNQDPLLVRILFLVAFLGFGVGFLIYVLLWVVIPVAATTAQKLEMRGEEVNFGNIGRFVKDEFNQVKKNMKF